MSNAGLSSKFAIITAICAGLCLAACDRGERPEWPEPTVQPQWPADEPEISDPNQPVPPAPVVAHPPDAAPVVPVPLEQVAVAPPPAPSLSLKERFLPGTRFMRDLRIDRAYNVRVQTGLAASVEGGVELRRSYTVDVEDSIGGQIVSATITVDRDSRRIPPIGGRGEVRIDETELTGASLHCQLTPDGGYQCDSPELELGELSLVGILPQRPAMLPGRPASAGQTWEISGRDAELFLGVTGADVAVHFTFDSADVTFRDASCSHVSYVYEGTQPIQLSGQTLSANVSGTGEYYYCRGLSAVLHHRQEREVTFEGPVIRQGNTTPMERTEHIVLEEETFLAPR